MASLSVFLPAYNEKENLAAAVREIATIVGGIVADYEIIIVEDGSTDGTARLADELAASIPNVRAAHQPRNGGYGSAVLRGLAEATKDYVFYTDADRQYDYSEIAKYWPLARKYDVLAGYRHHRVDPLTRHIFAWGYGYLLRFFFAFPFRDADCSFKFLRRERIGGITIDSRSGFVEAELLLKCRLHGLRIKQVPVNHFGRSAGTVSFEVFRRGPLSLVKFGPIWAMFVDILRCRRRIGVYQRRVTRSRLRREAGLS